ncbi:DUF6011 domain-containing protein [Streptomyces sp. NPDC005531]|uniref:DUF6011 domain-containing protein n=1 Tax=Streptomyces sp. NPDC005531 TaxID=3364722 RepID=UPI00368792BB
MRRMPEPRGSDVTARTLDADSTGRASTAPRCWSCGRVLRSEASRRRGQGPHCWRAAHGRTAVRMNKPVLDAPPEQIPGQIELHFPPMQHQLTWST